MHDDKISLIAARRGYGAGVGVAAGDGGHVIPGLLLYDCWAHVCVCPRTADVPGKLDLAVYACGGHCQQAPPPALTAAGTVEMVAPRVAQMRGKQTKGGADERTADERTVDARTVDAMPGPGGSCIATASMRSGDGSGGGGDPLRCGGWLFPQQARRTWRRRPPRAATAVCLTALGCWPLSLSTARPLPSATADARTPHAALTHATLQRKIP